MLPLEDSFENYVSVRAGNGIPGSSPGQAPAQRYGWNRRLALGLDGADEIEITGGSGNDTRIHVDSIRSGGDAGVTSVIIAVPVDIVLNSRSSDRVPAQDDVVAIGGISSFSSWIITIPQWSSARKIRPIRRKRRAC